jgi:hypothetical protein
MINNPNGIKGQKRQGDIFFKKVDPKVAKKMKQKYTVETKEGDERGTIVAHGEVTGHAHALENVDGVTLWTEAGKLAEVMLLEVKKATSVNHEEHTAFTLDEGWYEVKRAKEYTPSGWKVVAD